MKKIIEYTFEGKTELGIVGKATPLKDDLGNELKVGDVVFFQFEDDSKMFGVVKCGCCKEPITHPKYGSAKYCLHCGQRI